VASRGATACPPTSSVGIQYAAVSAPRPHVVRAASRVSRVENALVDALPTKL
jgi:hypothetical protein